MQDGSVTLINTFELFKETALTDTDNICAGSDDCEKNVYNSYMNN